MAAGRAVQPPIRGSLFAGADADEREEDEEYARIEAAVTDMLYSPAVVTDLNQISEYIGETPSSLASSRPSPAAPIAVDTPDSRQLLRNRRRQAPASAAG